VKEREKNKHYTLMAVPHDAEGKDVRVMLPAFLVRASAIIILVSVSIFAFSILYSSFLSGKLIHYKRVVASSFEKDQNIDRFASESLAIETEMQALLDQNNSLRKLLGLKVEKTRITFAGGAVKAAPETKPAEDIKPIMKIDQKMKVKKIDFTLQSSFNEIKEEKNYIEQLKNRVQFLQGRMVSIPTGWPMRGALRSFFGFRSSPWNDYHTGIDIGAPYGAPVRATGPGRVKKAGWIAGYGKAVEIEHGFGYSSLYAHNSKIVVVAGERIKKGQVISYVGTSGNSTGPHLHYEVRRNGYAINPISFLGMTVVAASRYF
jgi:murein DD-endopeptidase MepM/ murein hydrolase activator NlpD